MEKEAKNKLKDAGIDVEEAVTRFMGNEALFLKMLKKFVDDPNYSELQEAVSKKSSEEAFKASHSLKGVSGNLSIFNLYDHTTLQVSLFREERAEEAFAMMDEIRNDYEKAVQAIRELP